MVNDVQYQPDMIHGDPARAILRFSGPVILGSVFQQLYNTVAAVIVGQLIGKEALAAVGVANNIMSVVIFFLFGICLGISMVMAQYYGAGDEKNLRLEVSTSLLTGIIFTLLLSLVCFFLSRPVLLATRTPADIVADTDAYLKVIFSGLVFSFLYNYYAAALRAIGDSKTPLYFLIISSVLNVFLVFFFVGNRQWGVAGAAWATVIAQAVSSLLCIIYVYKKVPLLALYKGDFHFHKKMLKLSIRYGWVSGVQQTFLYVGRLLVQGAVNPLGTSVVAAYNAATRIEGFVLAPFDSMSATISTYCAHNVGARQPERIRRGYRITFWINLGFAFVFCLILILGGKFLLSLFVHEGDATTIVDIGYQYLFPMAFACMLPGICNITQGFFRGMGHLKIAMSATCLQIVLRVIASYQIIPLLGVAGACYASVIGWTVMIAFSLWRIRHLFRHLATELPTTL